MRMSARHRRISCLFVLAGVSAIPLAGWAEDKIYPPGTDCANQPTIAERLLCGRQEFRRQQGTSVEQPMETPPSPPSEAEILQGKPSQPALTTEQQQLVPRTSSPNN